MERTQRAKQRGISSDNGGISSYIKNKPFILNLYNLYWLWRRTPHLRVSLCDWDTIMSQPPPVHRRGGVHGLVSVPRSYVHFGAETRFREMNTFVPQRPILTSDTSVHGSKVRFEEVIYRPSITYSVHQVFQDKRIRYVTSNTVIYGVTTIRVTLL